MDEIGDDLLAVFLNPSEKVIVGHQLFEINMKTEKVSVWEYQESDLKSVSSDNLIGVFGCDEDVFDILESGELKSISRHYCHTRATKKNCDRIYFGRDDEYYVDYDMHIRYFKAGIYNSLNAKINQISHIRKINIYVNECRFKRRKKHEKNNTKKHHTESTEDQHLNYRPYWGTRRLESYTFDVTFSGSYDNGINLMTNTLRQKCS